MKIIIAILISTCMALLSGCAATPFPPVEYQPPQKPNFGSNAPAPIIEPPKPIIEPKLVIFNKKLELVTNDTVSISFETNIPSTSSVKLLTGEVAVDTQSINDKVKYHYYKFTNLKQVKEYYVSIEAVANTKDASVIIFTTQGNVEPYQPPPVYYFYNQGYYYQPYIPYIPTPIPATPVQFWSATITITVE